MIEDVPNGNTEREKGIKDWMKGKRGKNERLNERNERLNERKEKKE